MYKHTTHSTFINNVLRFNCYP